MADVSMCQDEQCPSRGDCYRQQAKPNEHWQSYFMTSPRSPNDKCCEFFIPLKDVI